MAAGERGDLFYLCIYLDRLLGFMIGLRLVIAVDFGIEVSEYERGHCHVCGEFDGVPRW